MQNQNFLNRRTLVKSILFGSLVVSIPNISYASRIRQSETSVDENPKVFHRYPSIDDKIVKEVVGASHFNFDRVKELVNRRPELARATWDWAFGDWETALGAASHVGRRDIAEFLMSKGARPDIFTYAMLGHFKTVKSMIESTPGVQRIDGPHGISLLSHAKFGLRSKTITAEQRSESEKLIKYLEELGDAESKIQYINLEDSDKEKYVGDYLYGDGPKDGLTVKLNMRKQLSLGKLGQGGGGLLQKSLNVFVYNGITSVEISFQILEDKVESLTITEPDLVLIAKKV